MNDLLLKQKKISIVSKTGEEIELTVYSVIVNDIEVVLKPNDFTCKAILEKYFEGINK